MHLISSPAFDRARHRPDKCSDTTLAALDIGTNSFHLVVARAGNGTGLRGDRRPEGRRAPRPRRWRHEGASSATRSNVASPRSAACSESPTATARRCAPLPPAPSARRRTPTSSSPVPAAVDVDVEVISGVEEARLIHLGVLQAVPVFDQRLFLVDIGGGSTEVLVGRRGETLAARSLKLGAVRLSDRFFPGEGLHPSAVSSCRQFVRSILAVFEHEVEAIGFDVAIASSGTAEAIARIVARDRATSTPLPHTFNCFEFTQAEVCGRGRSCWPRRRRSRHGGRSPASTPARADIIVAGALVLEGVADVFGVKSFDVQRLRAARGCAARHDRPHDRRPRCRARAPRRRPSIGAPARRALRRRPRPLRPRCPAGHRSCSTRPASCTASTTPSATTSRLPRCWPTSGLVISHSKHHLHSYYVIRNSRAGRASPTPRSS